jgi:hypothetical protein
MRSNLLFVGWVLFSAAAGTAAALAVQPQHATANAVRGLASYVEIDYAPALKAHAEQSPVSPVLVRVKHLGNGKQRIEFIGNVAGDFDLRDYLEREDGRPLADLGSIPISIASQLPPGHGTDLFSFGDSWFDWRAHYRELLWGAVIFWAAVPAVYLVLRSLRRKRQLPVEPAREPVLTIEDELRLALARSAGRELTIAERGQLELLVFRYFGERVGDPGAGAQDPAETLRLVREHRETRELVQAIERWLHAYGSSDADQARAAAALEDLRRSRLERQGAATVELAGAGKMTGAGA